MISFTPVNSLFGSIQQYADFQQARFGLAYYTDLDREDDNEKLSHYVRSDRTGDWYEVDFTPYNHLTQDDLFELAQSIDRVEEYEIACSVGCEFDL
jgi:hypothetical protein